MSQDITSQQHSSATIHTYSDKRLPTPKQSVLVSAPTRSASSLLTRRLRQSKSRPRTARVRRRLALQTMGNVPKTRRLSSYSAWTLLSSVSSSSSFTLDTIPPLLMHGLRRRVRRSTSRSQSSLTRRVPQRKLQCLLLPTSTLTKLLRVGLYLICISWLRTSPHSVWRTAVIMSLYHPLYTPTCFLSSSALQHSSTKRSTTSTTGLASTLLSARS